MVTVISVRHLVCWLLLVPPNATYLLLALALDGGARYLCSGSVLSFPVPFPHVPILFSPFTILTIFPPNVQLVLPFSISTCSYEAVDATPCKCARCPRSCYGCGTVTPPASTTVGRLWPPVAPGGAELLAGCRQIVLACVLVSIGYWCVRVQSVKTW